MNIECKFARSLIIPYKLPRIFCLIRVFLFSPFSVFAVMLILSIVTITLGSFIWIGASGESKRRRSAFASVSDDDDGVTE